MLETVLDDIQRVLETPAGSRRPGSTAMRSRARPSGSRPDTRDWRARSVRSSTHSARPAFE